MAMETELRASLEASGLTDEAVVGRVLDGEAPLFELLMRRHNALVYRSIRSIVRDETEVEEVMQQAYVQAYVHLRQFAGTARFSTWLVRIAVNEALRRRRGDRKWSVITGGVDDQDDRADGPDLVAPSPLPSPEEQVANHELAGMLEQAIDSIPELYRTVFMLREVQGMSTAETAEALEVSDEVVKTRLHRARGLLQERLNALARENLRSTFPFPATRCDRVVAKVLEQILP